MSIAPRASAVPAADVEAWLAELGLEPLERADREGVTSWDLVLDGTPPRRAPDHAHPRPDARAHLLGPLRPADQRFVPQVVPQAAALERRAAVREVLRRARTSGRCSSRSCRSRPSTRDALGLALARQLAVADRFHAETRRLAQGRRLARARPRPAPGRGARRTPGARSCSTPRTPAELARAACEPADERRRRPRPRRAGMTRRLAGARVAARPAWRSRPRSSSRRSRPSRASRRRAVPRGAATDLTLVTDTTYTVQPDAQPGPRRGRRHRAQQHHGDEDAPVLLRPRVPRRPARARPTSRSAGAKGARCRSQKRTQGRDAAPDRLRRAGCTAAGAATFTVTFDLVDKGTPADREVRVGPEPRHAPGLGATPRTARRAARSRSGSRRASTSPSSTASFASDDDDRRRRHACSRRRHARASRSTSSPSSRPSARRPTPRRRSRRRPATRRSSSPPRLGGRPRLGERVGACSSRSLPVLARGDRPAVAARRAARRPGGGRAASADGYAGLFDPADEPRRGRLLGRSAGRRPRGRPRLVQRLAARRPLGERGVRRAVRAARRRGDRGRGDGPGAHGRPEGARDPAQRLGDPAARGRRHARGRARRRRGEPGRASVRLRRLVRARDGDRRAGGRRRAARRLGRCGRRASARTSPAPARRPGRAPDARHARDRRRRRRTGAALLDLLEAHTGADFTDLWRECGRPARRGRRCSTRAPRPARRTSGRSRSPATGRCRASIRDALRAWDFDGGRAADGRRPHGARPARRRSRRWPRTDGARPAGRDAGAVRGRAARRGVRPRRGGAQRDARDRRRRRGALVRRRPADDDRDARRGPGRRPRRGAGRARGGRPRRRRSRPRTTPTAAWTGAWQEGRRRALLADRRARDDRRAASAVIGRSAVAHGRAARPGSAARVRACRRGRRCRVDDDPTAEELLAAAAPPIPDTRRRRRPAPPAARPDAARHAPTRRAPDATDDLCHHGAGRTCQPDLGDHRAMRRAPTRPVLVSPAGLALAAGAASSAGRARRPARSAVPPRSTRPRPRRGDLGIRTATRYVVVPDKGVVRVVGRRHRDQPEARRGPSAARPPATSTTASTSACSPRHATSARPRTARRSASTADRDGYRLVTVLFRVDLFFGEQREGPAPVRPPGGQAALGQRRPGRAGVRVVPRLVVRRRGTDPDRRARGVRRRHLGQRDASQRRRPPGPRCSAPTTDDPLSWFAWVNARNDDGLTREQLELADGDEVVLVRAWPEDLALAATASRRILGDGIPELTRRIGLPWPVDGALSVLEIHTPLLEGYAGFYDPETDEITISEDLDDADDRPRGVARVVQPAAVHRALDHRGPRRDVRGARRRRDSAARRRPDGGRARRAGGVPARRAGRRPPPIKDDEASDREQFGYDAGVPVMAEIVDEAGEDGHAAGVRGGRRPARRRTPARRRRSGRRSPRTTGAGSSTSPSSSAARTASRASCRRGPSPTTRRRCCRRAPTPARRTQALAAVADGWAAPVGVRLAMDGWRFDEAGAGIEAATGVLERRDRGRGAGGGAGPRAAGRARGRVRGGDRTSDAIRAVGAEQASAEASLQTLATAATTRSPRRATG